MGRKKPRTPTSTPSELAAALKRVILGNTDIMRQDDHPFWVLIRQFLRDHGVDSTAALVAESDPYGKLQGGFIVAADGRVYQYTYDWGGTSSIGFGYVTDWRDVTTTWPELTTDTQGRLHRDLIKLALEVLHEDRQIPPGDPQRRPM